MTFFFFFAEQKGEKSYERNDNFQIRHVCYEQTLYMLILKLVLCIKYIFWLLTYLI